MTIVIKIKVIDGSNWSKKVKYTALTNPKILLNQDKEEDEKQQKSFLRLFFI